jgi:predicted dehydrogenase
LKNINKKLSIGIVGCGRISGKHLSAINSLYLKSKLQLKCVCDSDIKKAKLVSIKYKVPAYQNMYEMAKNEKLDIISILTESGNHPTHFVNLAKYAKIFEEHLHLFKGVSRIGNRNAIAPLIIGIHSSTFK